MNPCDSIDETVLELIRSGHLRSLRFVTLFFFSLSQHFIDLQLLLTLQDLATSEPDEELRELAQLDVEPALESLQSIRRSLLEILLPPSPTYSLSALVELKSGVGGSEASLFLGNLLKMYQRLSSRKGWKTTVIEADRIQASGGAGGGEAFKEAILEVSGEGAFGVLRREAGVHRVQRVPQTESQGRVHTSTVSVIVSLDHSSESCIRRMSERDPVSHRSYQRRAGTNRARLTIQICLIRKMSK
jgi:protein subunit release factor A